MSLDIIIPEDPKPPKIRIWKIFIDNGEDHPEVLTKEVNGETVYYVAFSTAPFVEVLLRGVWPLDHPITGEQMINSAGQPAYINSNYFAIVKIPAEELLSFMSLWEDLMAVSYTKIEAAVAANTIEWKRI